MTVKKLFFIYVARNSEWQQRQKEDWAYVSSMSRFYHWWIKRYFNIDFTVDADILPVVPGKLFDRMSLEYLIRDHNERGKSIFHFYLAYFKPLWTDCQTEGYSAENFGMIHWKRPTESVPDNIRIKFFANTNCAKISHVLSHEIIRMTGKKRKEYFEAVHEIWNRHIHKELPYIYYNERFIRTSEDSSYRFVTFDINKYQLH